MRAGGFQPLAKAMPGLDPALQRPPCLFLSASRTVSSPLQLLLLGANAPSFPLHPLRTFPIALFAGSSALKAPIGSASHRSSPGENARGVQRGDTHPGPDMIRIHVLEGKALVWNYADVRRIREEHRIVGTLFGALARKPRQNVRLGLPLQLLPEEARLLLENGLAILCKNPASPALGEDTSQEVAVYQKELEENYQEQCRLAAEQRKALLDTLAERIAQGRAKKRQREGEEEESSSKLAEPEPSFVLPRDSMMVQLPTERINPGQEVVVDWRVPSKDWPYAGQPDHEAHYRIFRNLWERGFYVTSGSKFGGNFLVYPGDPMRFHAHYIALCVPRDTPLSLCDIISAGRLGSNVKKTVLLCSADEDGTVVYTSLQWTGMQ
ncbi:tRNA-splicing endonuclease subunit Sen34 [Anolis carolinensis]|nr:PREDICTED: tRNA-splicing endonuclease subunit Sen34 [Anolis carolinensis]|eukprot:XP_008115448.1 PREDICTED: tRNA-splicing endonuclease subunit Sen34 [Anolis carolinensis]